MEFSNSLRHCEGAKRPKLGILDSALGILEFPTMSSPSLTVGSLFCDEIPRSSQGMTQGLGILDLSLGILEFLRIFA